MMDREQLLFLKLMEEASEVSQRASKIIQFGMEEVQSGQSLTNRERLNEELQDLEAIIDMLNSECLIGFDKNWVLARNKHAKVNKYAEYSKSLGRLEDGKEERTNQS